MRLFIQSIIILLLPVSVYANIQCDQKTIPSSELSSCSLFHSGGYIYYRYTDNVLNKDFRFAYKRTGGKSGYITVDNNAQSKCQASRNAYPNSQPSCSALTGFARNSETTFNTLAQENSIPSFPNIRLRIDYNESPAISIDHASNTLTYRTQRDTIDELSIAKAIWLAFSDNLFNIEQVIGHSCAQVLGNNNSNASDYDHCLLVFSSADKLAMLNGVTAMSFQNAKNKLTNYVAASNETHYRRLFAGVDDVFILVAILAIGIEKIIVEDINIADSDTVGLQLHRTFINEIEDTTSVTTKPVIHDIQDLSARDVSFCEIYNAQNTKEFVNCNNTAYALCKDPSNILRVTANQYNIGSMMNACIHEFGVGSSSADGSDSNNTISSVLGNKRPASTGAVETGKSKRTKYSDQRIQNNRSNLSILDNSLASVTLDKNKYNYLFVHTMSVGAGSCHILECSGGPVAVVDCGSSGGNPNRYDSWAIQEYMTARGMFLFDPAPTLLISHPDKDHVNYMSEIFTGRSPDNVYLGGFIRKYQQRRSNGTSGTWRDASNVNLRLLDTLLAKSGNFQINGKLKSSIGAGGYTEVPTFPQTISNNSPLVDFGSQCSNIKLRKAVVNSGGANEGTTNKDSLVLYLDYGSTLLMVLPGDAEGDTESQAWASMYSWGIRQQAYNRKVLVASHHGSDTHGSNGYNWIDQIKPTDVLYSSGRTHRHPHCATRDRYRNQGALISRDSHYLSCGNLGQTTRIIDENSLKSELGTYDSGSSVLILGIPKNSQSGEQPTVEIVTKIRSRP